MVQLKLLEEILFSKSFFESRIAFRTKLNQESYCEISLQNWERQKICHVSLFLPTNLRLKKCLKDTLPLPLHVSSLQFQ